MVRCQSIALWRGRRLRMARFRLPWIACRTVFRSDDGAELRLVVFQVGADGAVPIDRVVARAAVADGPIQAALDSLPDCVQIGRWCGTSTGSVSGWRGWCGANRSRCGAGGGCGWPDSGCPG